jgi:PHD/YefM family antitoxin component YafN of YafNO toxin-antitoxin module
MVRVCEDHEPLIITCEETAYLLRSHLNTACLLAAIERN